MNLDVKPLLHLLFLYNLILLLLMKIVFYVKNKQHHYMTELR